MSGELPTESGAARTRLDRLYDDWLTGGAPSWTAAIDIVRTNSHLIVRADLPGVKPEAVRIDVEDDTLTVSGEPETPGDAADARYLRRERRACSFCRSMALPPGVNAEHITATTRDGVVELTIPLPVAPAAEKAGRSSP